MYLLDELIECSSRSDRIEIFPFYDTHIGKRNCMEHAIKKQVSEIIRRSKLPNRHVRVLLGGDQTNAINQADIRRFDFAELADWLVQGDAETTRDMLGSLVGQEVKHAVSIFKPIRQFILGAILGNHEKTMRTRSGIDVHSDFCERLEITNLTDEALIRIRAYDGNQSRTIKIYMRHGYGGGRTAGAEPNKLDRMMAEWEDADVCLTGHTHSFCIAPPKLVLRVPNRGEMPKTMLQTHRFAANCGCWLASHLEGVGSYESAACYPARPMMTLKIVVWPFWSTHRDGEAVSMPKIELRQYPIL